MFRRNLLKYLEDWKKKPGRKPLIVRGARQTGKTACVEIFGKSFTHFISLNLERESDLRLFEGSTDLREAIQAIELAKHQRLFEPDTLLLIDEIQASPKAIAWLRFFYEDHPDLFVIAAGSLLEVVIAQQGISFPVGRVEFLYLFPVSFDEYLEAVGASDLLGVLSEVSPGRPASGPVHDMALRHFLDYLKVGGMPEAVARFAETKSFQPLASIHEALLRALSDDLVKYARHAEVKYLRHVIENVPFDAGERITYEKFGHSHYRSREMRQAFDVLEQAMILRRVYGSASVAPPMEPHIRTSPKVVFLDVGLVFHKLGAGYFRDSDNFFRGKMAEQIVGQSLIAAEASVQKPLCYWYRNAPHATAETDFLISDEKGLLPIEVKAGKTGRLRSLHQFLKASAHDLIIRVYTSPLALDEIQEPQRGRLLSVPFYLVWRLPEIVSTIL